MSTRQYVLTFFICLFLTGAAQVAGEEPFLDLDFERGVCGSRWSFNGSNYRIESDKEIVASGQQSLRMRYVGGIPWTSQSGFGVGLQTFPLEAAAGKRIRYSGSIRTDSVQQGWAGLWWRVDGEFGSLAFDNMSNRGPRGSTPWTRYQIELDVPSFSKGIVFGVLFVGEGTAWFDDLSIELSGELYPQPSSPPTEPVSEEATAWLQQQVIPFVTAEAGHGFDDLQPLKNLIGDARIVSLGEATHGTAEFFKMKHRLTEFLATEMGFTHFAIEANMPEAYRVNDYVLTGLGDPKVLLRGMYFWTWNTQEVLDMILWMREFNQSGKGSIQFLGFDMQFPTLSIEIVRPFVAQTEPGYLIELDQAYDAVSRAFARSGDWSAARVAAQAVLEHLEAARDLYRASFEPADVEWLIQNARLIHQTTLMNTGGDSRDLSMARNADWILRQAPPDAKIILWAHNAHVSKKVGWMGSYLADWYGSQMVVLGFAFDQGLYNAVGPNGLGPYDAPPILPGSVESFLVSAGRPRFIVDLRGISSESPASPWVNDERPFRSIGAVAVTCGFLPSVVSREYDGLIFFDQTMPSVLLR